jgi:hypothetical protein
VVSLAVLADDEANWRPERYEDDCWGWSVRMVWPTVKLLDYADREAELEQSKNPFAAVVLAHLKTLQTRRDPESRQAWKMRLVRGLYERSLADADVAELYRVIDWLMELSSRRQAAFRREFDEYEEGRRMPYVTTFERHVMCKLIEDSLRTKFGEEGAALMPAIIDLDDAEKFLALNRTILTATTVAEVRRACSEAARSLRRKRKREAERDAAERERGEG